MLEQLRSRGLKLFLGTNSHFEYMNFIMRASLGEDWERLFELNLANCRKPVFFTTDQTPFYEVDTAEPNMKGRAITDAGSLQANKAYLEGNSYLVHAYFRQLLGKEEVRVAYCGDHFWSDALAATYCKPRGQPAWQSIGVVEELWWFNNGSSEGKDPHLIDNSTFWGANHFVDTLADGSQVKNFFTKEMETAARYAVPFLKNLGMLLR